MHAQAISFNVKEVNTGWQILKYDQRAVSTYIPLKSYQMKVKN